jgi:hypothetical protein
MPLEQMQLLPEEVKRKFLDKLPQNTTTIKLIGVKLYGTENPVGVDKTGFELIGLQGDWFIYTKNKRQSS